MKWCNTLWKVIITCLLSAWWYSDTQTSDQNTAYFLINKQTSVMLVSHNGKTSVNQTFRCFSLSMSLQNHSIIFLYRNNSVFLCDQCSCGRSRFCSELMKLWFISFVSRYFQFVLCHLFLFLHHHHLISSSLTRRLISSSLKPVSPPNATYSNHY